MQRESVCLTGLLIFLSVLEDEDYNDDSVQLPVFPNLTHLTTDAPYLQRSSARLAELGIQTTISRLSQALASLLKLPRRSTACEVLFLHDGKEIHFDDDE